MHGVIFYELEQHAVAKVGPERWRALLARTGHDALNFTPVSSHPDESLFSLVGALSNELGLPPAELLTEFGRFLAPALVDLYRPFIDPAWSFAEMLQNVERVIHRAVRVSDPAATPPRLEVLTTSPEQVVLRYTSRRRLCALAVGLIEGLAQSYEAKASIEQPSCMHLGDATCTLVVHIEGG